MTPDGYQKAPVDASRFFSNQQELQAAQRAQTIFQQTGKTSFSFEMESSIGEGFTKGGGAYVQTNTVQAVFRNGQLFTMFPKLKP